MNKQTQPVQMQSQVVLITPAELRDLVNNAVVEGLQAAEAKRRAALEQDQQPELLSRKQAAELLGVSSGTIDNYARQGLLTKRKIGSHSVRFERVEIEKLARRV
jgi:excisionase family DNA binding protein